MHLKENTCSKAVPGTKLKQMQRALLNPSGVWCSAPRKTPVGFEL